MVSAWRALTVGLLLGFLLDGCATPAAFTYRFYGLSAVSYDGTLLGPKPADDQSMKLCEPMTKEKGRCVVMFREEFYRMKGDFEFLEKQLIACQQSGGRAIE